MFTCFDNFKCKWKNSRDFLYKNVTI
jgi:hypothetical protein